jgi:hypothetical protein
MWTRILTFLHLPGGIVSPQPPTVTSCKFTDSLAPGPYPPGSQPQITVEAESNNTSAANWVVPVNVADTVADLSDSGSATGTIEVFNELLASINDDPAGHTWTLVPGSATQTSKGVYTAVLTTTV